MASSIYKINKGINKSIEFQGLKAQNICDLGVDVMGLLIIFATLYIIGIIPFNCLVLILTVRILMIIKIQTWSRKYSEHGTTKDQSRKKQGRKKNHSIA